MRKSFVAILCLALIAGCFYFLRRPTTSTIAPNQNAASESPSVVAAPENQSPTPPRWTKPARSEVSPEGVPPGSDAIVYGPADFTRGELQNIVVGDDGIRLGDNASFVPRFNPKFRLFGNFISPEIDSSQPFDSLQLKLQASSLGNNEMIFEVRTRAKDGSWSEWREISPEAMKEPFAAPSPKSTGWQYRVTLFANDAPSSPKVETVSIEPLSNTQQNLSSNNNTQLKN